LRKALVEAIDYELVARDYEESELLRQRAPQSTWSAARKWRQSASIDTLRQNAAKYKGAPQQPELIQEICDTPDPSTTAATTFRSTPSMSAGRGPAWFRAQPAFTAACSVHAGVGCGRNERPTATTSRQESPPPETRPASDATMGPRARGRDRQA
jgi:hypothetical protein